MVCRPSNTFRQWFHHSPLLEPLCVQKSSSRSRPTSLSSSVPAFYSTEWIQISHQTATVTSVLIACLFGSPSRQKRSRSRRRIVRGPCKRHRLLSDEPEPFLKAAPFLTKRLEKCGGYCRISNKTWRGQDYGECIRLFLTICPRIVYSQLRLAKATTHLSFVASSSMEAS